MKQTAVEWLAEQLPIYGYNVITVFPELIEQAKEMEQTNTDNKVIHFAEWLTKKHTYTLITLYKQFKNK
jgi:hypothetical protein